MTGKVRLYSSSGRMMRSLFFSSKDDIKKIIERWRDFYGFKMDGGWIQVLPNITEGKVINMKSTGFINRERTVINRTTADIEMPDFVIDKGLKHETYYHRCYCRGEK